MSSARPGESACCSSSKATGANAGSASALSGGKVRTTKRVPPGAGSRLVTLGVGSSPDRLGGSAGPLGQWGEGTAGLA